MLSIYYKKQYHRVNKDVNNYTGLTNLRLLNKCNLRCPDFQRVLKEGIVKEIEDEHKSKTLNTILFEVGYLNDEYYLLDGQHRYQALQNIGNKDYEFTIHLHKLNTYDELKSLFFLINKNTTIPDEWIAITNHSNIKIHLKQIYQLDIFKEILKTSNKPYKPNISRSKFEDLIVDLYSKDYKITTEHIIKLNAFYKTLSYDNFPSSSGKTNQEYLKLCNDKGGCYIGMVIQKRDNYDILVDNLKKIYDNKCIEPTTYGNIKKKIPSNVREIVWKNYLSDTGQTSNEIKCPVSICNKIIDGFNFECGHIMSEKNNGKIALTNLRPICSSCNKSMGSRNWDDFEKMFEEEDVDNVKDEVKEDVLKI
jgi:hypothetical protein